jgi:hypothetical protein
MNQLAPTAQMANQASTRTTHLYDRRAEEGTLDEVGKDIGLTLRLISCWTISRLTV